MILESCRAVRVLALAGTLRVSACPHACVPSSIKCTLRSYYRLWNIRFARDTLCPSPYVYGNRDIPQSHTTALPSADWCRVSPQRPGCGQRLQHVRGQGAARRVYATAIARSLIDGLGLHLRLSQIPWLAGGRWALDALRGGIAVQRTAARAAEIARAPGGGSRVLARRGAPVKAAAHTAWIRNRLGLELG